ncbi:hypothetical protein MTBBW1_1880027 [Desulfamplus magnetovallimortis]|uniref:Uncharacterized protein n=1 Tax=Desulfamplus magnetovallimortis TaxID=1246637 RepID=A0A1W1HAT3_9BACT|nr:hypothetical protein MTBBW1_1880027 [Desulfamplus magnetovallimortis]
MPDSSDVYKSLIMLIKFVLWAGINVLRYIEVNQCGQQKLTLSPMVDQNILL